MLRGEKEMNSKILETLPSWKAKKILKEERREKVYKKEYREAKEAKE